MKLRDPFDTVHKKDIKNKRGEVVAQVDYVGWSQAADRLDDTSQEWSFSILGIGEDWVHGRLTIGDRHWENIGYAENAEAEWKKEVLKDAASDAFKRCAALAGVARYLYDKDSPARPPAQARPAARPVAVPSPAADGPEFAPNDWDAVPYTGPVPEFPPFAGVQPNVGDECPLHPGEKWRGSVGDLYHGPKGVTPDGYCRPAGQPKKARRA